MLSVFCITHLVANAHHGLQIRLDPQGPGDSIECLDQSGQIISGTELGTSKSYTYDKAGRLTAATIGANSWSYGFGTPYLCGQSVSRTYY